MSFVDCFFLLYTVDAIAGRDKYDLCNGFIHGMSPEARNEFFKNLSEAWKCRDYLNRPERGANDSKHRPTDGRYTLQKRHYEVTNHEDGVTLAHCHWKINENQWNKELKPDWARVEGESKWWTTQKGLSEMFHFRFHWQMADSIAAVRRIPCLCENCYNTLSLPWDTEAVNTKGVKDEHNPRFQRKFKQVPGCRYEGVLGDLNNWNFVKVVEKSPLDQTEMNIVFHDLLEEKDASNEATIEIGKFGAVSADYSVISAPDGIKMVQWMSEPHLLTEPTKVEGVDWPEEGMAAWGVYWEPVFGATPQDGRWYEMPEKGTTEHHKLFSMRSVLAGKVECQSASKHGTIPAADNLRYYNQTPIRRKMTQMLPDLVYQDLKIEKHVRDQMQILKVEGAEEIELAKEQNKIDKEAEQQATQDKNQERRLASLLHKPDAQTQTAATAQHKKTKKAGGRKPKDGSKKPAPKKKKKPTSNASKPVLAFGK